MGLKIHIKVKVLSRPDIRRYKVNCGSRSRGVAYPINTVSTPIEEAASKIRGFKACMKLSMPQFCANSRLGMASRGLPFDRM
jgi:hypothetical protein